MLANALLIIPAPEDITFWDALTAFGVLALLFFGGMLLWGKITGQSFIVDDPNEPPRTPPSQDG